MLNTFKKICLFALFKCYNCRIATWIRVLQREVLFDAGFWNVVSHMQPYINSPISIDTILHLPTSFARYTLIYEPKNAKLGALTSIGFYKHPNDHIHTYTHIHTLYKTSYYLRKKNAKCKMNLKFCVILPLIFYLNFNLRVTWMKLM